MSPSGSRFVLAVLAAAVLWGTTGTVAHQAPTGSPQIVVGMSTFGFGGVLLFLLDARAVLTAMAHRATWPLVLAGALGVVGYASLYYVSMKLVGVAVGNALALGSGPVWAATFEFVGERRRLSRPQALAIFITVAGVLLLASASHTGAGEHPAAGVACALGAGCGYGLYSWAGAGLIAHGHPSRAAMGAIFFLAAVALIPALLVIGPGPLAHLKGILVLGYLAVLPMAGAYLLFGYVLRAMTASTATTLALAEPDGRHPAGRPGARRAPHRPGMGRFGSDRDRARPCCRARTSIDPPLGDITDHLRRSAMRSRRRRLA